MSQSVTFTELGPPDFRLAIGQFVAVYSAAMNPPERMLAGRESILERHAANPGFRALAAVAHEGETRGDEAGRRETSGGEARKYDKRGDEARGDDKHGGETLGGKEPAGTIAGFTYGFHGAHGQWWHDMVASALATAPTSYGSTLATAWLANSFEVAELHVLPAYQGAGIGRSLLRRLLSGRPERTALLSTQDAESKARRLYRGVGFTDLLTGFRFSGGEPPYAIMGATLPLRPDRPDTGRPDTGRPDTGRPDTGRPGTGRRDDAGGHRPDATATPLPPPNSPRPSIW